jgi:biopolymer transport protein ExbD
MLARNRRKKRHTKSIHSELELMPMLNVFIAIIPLLLLSAAFVPVTVIKTTLPATGAAVAVRDAPLDLAVVIQADRYVILLDGGELRTVLRSSPDPTAEMTAALKAFAASHPEHREVRIVSRSDTRYEEIIAVMDMARAAGLPEAALGDGAGS